MNTPTKFITYSLFVAMSLTSCVQQSKYDEVCAENSDLQKKINDLDSIMNQQNNQLSNLQTENSNQSYAADENVNKGKDELQYVESTLNDIATKIKRCESEEAFYDIKKNTEDLRDQVSSYLFSNY